MRCGILHLPRIFYRIYPAIACACMRSMAVSSPLDTLGMSSSLAFVVSLPFPIFLVASHNSFSLVDNCPPTCHMDISRNRDTNCFLALTHSRRCRGDRCPWCPRSFFSSFLFFLLYAPSNWDGCFFSVLALVETANESANNSNTRIWKARGTRVNFPSFFFCFVSVNLLLTVECQIIFELLMFICLIACSLAVVIFGSPTTSTFAPVNLCTLLLFLQMKCQPLSGQQEAELNERAKTKTLGRKHKQEKFSNQTIIWYEVRTLTLLWLAVAVLFFILFTVLGYRF